MSFFVRRKFWLYNYIIYLYEMKIRLEIEWKIWCNMKYLYECFLERLGTFIYYLCYCIRKYYVKKMYFDYKMKVWKFCIFVGKYFNGWYFSG